MHARHRHLMDREGNAACQGAYSSIFGPVKTSQLVFRVSPAYGELTGHGRVNQVPLEREGERGWGVFGGESAAPAATRRGLKTFLPPLAELSHSFPVMAARKITNWLPHFL